MTCDFICLVLQGAGGGITATSPGMDEDAKTTRQMGVDIMIGGLAFHVVSLFCFMVYAGVYAWRWKGAVKRGGVTGSQSGLRWKALIFGKFRTRCAITGLRCHFIRAVEPSRSLTTCRPRHRRNHHLRPVCLPSRRTPKRLRKSACPRRNRIHDPRRYHGCHRLILPDRVSSWLVPGRAVEAAEEEPEDFGGRVVRGFGECAWNEVAEGHGLCVSRVYSCEEARWNEVAVQAGRSARLCISRISTKSVKKRSATSREEHGTKVDVSNVFWSFYVRSYTSFTI